MAKDSKIQGKILPVVLLLLILMIVAAAAGYYLSWTRYEKKTQDLAASFDMFEGKYESRISDLQSDLVDMKVAVEASGGDNLEETNKLKKMGILLKAKGEIISCKLSLSREEMGQAMEHLDEAISVLKTASELSGEEVQIKIDQIRLQLASVQGLIDANPGRAEDELDKIWREIDALIES